MACRLNQTSSSFRATADHLARAAHIELSKETLRQLIEGEAQGVLRQMQRAELGPVWSAAECRSPQGPTRLYCGCDGVKVPLITSAEKQKRRENVKLKRRRRGRKCKPLPRAKDRRRQAAAVVVGKVVALDIDKNVDNPTRSRPLRGFFPAFLGTPGGSMSFGSIDESAVS